MLGSFENCTMRLSGMKSKKVYLEVLIALLSTSRSGTLVMIDRLGIS